ncbi:unnamed protein product [Prunus armeniaca]
MWEQVKLLGHMGKVSLKGVVNEELLDIYRDADLLSLCDKVPLSYKRVVLIYVQHIEEEGVAVNEDCEEVAVALNEDSENIGPGSGENRASTEGSKPLNNEKEGRPFTEHHGPACRVEDWVSSDDDGPLNNEGSRADIGDTDVEDSEEEDKEEDPDFVDNQPKVVKDPNAPVDEDRESTDVAKSDVESLYSSSDDEDDGNQKKRKKKLPTFQDFRPEIDMRNPVFKLGLRFATTDLFRKAIRNYSIVNKRMIKFKCNDRDRGCRPVIGFDAFQIKGHHPGQLLSTVGVDPNNVMYPIAYAVAEVENYETWSWFCQLLAEDLGIENICGYVFITDKQKGLIDAVHDHFPNAEHRHCLKHLEANFLLAGHKELVLKLQMEKIARSTIIPW